MIRTQLVLLCTALVACNGDDAPSDDTDDGTSSSTGLDCDVFVPGSCPSDETTLDPTTGDVDPSTSDGAGEESTSTGGAATECRESSECAPDFCVAPFNPALGVFGRGPFQCVAQCVDYEDELKWCADAAACCDPEATCTDRGYCEREGGGSTGADGTGGAGSSG